MRRQFPKADGGKWSQGLGEAGKGGTDELLARKILNIAHGRGKADFLCAEVLRFRSLLAAIIASKESLVSPYKIKPCSV